MDKSVVYNELKEEKPETIAFGTLFSDVGGPSAARSLRRVFCGTLKPRAVA
jgi:hypothetical protein